ncbi:MAG: hypothetical protein JWN72_1377, partial [Thermoleophilia bacterium]|nr:hypothetical protein [Thermoleophilia bacterium]
LALAWLVATVVIACFGSTENSENAAPNLVFVLGWIGLPFAALLLGRGALALHPVAALARLGGLREETETPPPARLGVWLAWLGLVVFIWLELVYPTAIHVRLIGGLVLAWTVTGIWAAARWGVRPWLESIDPIGTYTRVLASLAPWGRRADGNLGLRAPLVGPNRDLSPQPGLVAFVTLLIGTVSFDGLTRTGWWQERVSLASADLSTNGISAVNARLLFGSVGFVLLVVLVWGLFELAAWLAGRVGRLDRGPGLRRSAQAFAPSLVPIALAYVVAHYFSFFVVQVQDLVRYASDPLGRGHDYFGTSDFTLLDLHVPSGGAIWMVQVVAIVVGHVAGLLVAHDRALELAPKTAGGRPNLRRATLSQLPLLVLMLLYTVGGLYFLSEGLS